MGNKIAAVTGGVVLGIAIAFARAGAFPFWGNGAQTVQATGSSASSAHSSTTALAPVNQPEPSTKDTIPLPSWAPLVKKVMPSVVNVAVVQEVKTNGFGEPDQGGEQGGGNQGRGNPFGQGSPFGPGGPFGNNPFQQFRHFFGTPHQFKEHGLGSGVIVSPDGYILTNNHVVGHAEEIHVTLMDKREFTAKVVGTDPKTDLALIKINTKQPLPAATLGDSNTTQVGDWVIAIGSPFGFNLTVTSGIISAKGRALGGNYDNFLQTDASINPGNSGGPLFNTSGQVIGINTAIYSSTGSNAGIGFAIPIDLAKHVMEQLKKNGRVIRGWLGVEIQEVTPGLAKSFGLPQPEGALVAGVQSDSPASKAGLQRGDVIVQYNGQTVHDEHELPEMVALTPIGKEVRIQVIRNDKPVNLNVKIAELKETQVASAQGPEQPSNWGLQVQELTPDIAQQLNLNIKKGVVVRGVKPDSPAAEAGLQPGDVILEINRQKVNSVDEFIAKAKQAQRKGKSALLLVQRGNSTIYEIINSEG
ncbi:MAG: DegQ family serine endoprotease [Candidatus Binataceae bacterium]